MIESYARLIVRYRWLIIALTVIATMLLASGASKLSFTNDYRVFFSKENPQLQAFEALQDAYTKSDNVLLMLEPADGDVFSTQTLAAIADITERAWQVPYSIRVDSLTNYQHMVAKEDDLRVADLVEDIETVTTEDLESIRQVALAQPTLVRKLLSPDSTVTGINITMEMPEELSDQQRAEDPEAADPMIRR